jgi:hypothetical protein
LKTFILTIALATAAAFECQANIGWSLKECIAHYGKEVTPPVWHKGNTIHYFHYQNLKLEAWISDETNTVTQVSFWKPDRKELSIVEVSKLLDENGQDADWILQKQAASGLVQWIGQVQGKTYLTATYELLEGSGYNLTISFEREDQ